MPSDRRQSHWIKDLVIPLIIAVVVGVASAVMTVRVAVAVIETELIGVKNDVVDLKQILQVVNQNQLDKTRLNIIATDNREEIIGLWDEINAIKADKYTKEDGERDMLILRLEMKALHDEDTTQ